MAGAATGADSYILGMVLRDICGLKMQCICTVGSFHSKKKPQRYTETRMYVNLQYNKKPARQDNKP